MTVGSGVYSGVGVYVYSLKTTTIEVNQFYITYRALLGPKPGPLFLCGRTHKHFLEG